MGEVIDFYFRVNSKLHRVNNFDLLIDPKRPFAIMEQKRIYVKGLGVLEMDTCNISAITDYHDADEVLGYYQVYNMIVEGSLC